MGYEPKYPMQSEQAVADEMQRRWFDAKMDDLDSFTVPKSLLMEAGFFLGLWVQTEVDENGAPWTSYRGIKVLTEQQLPIANAQGNAAVAAPLPPAEPEIATVNPATNEPTKPEDVVVNPLSGQRVQKEVILNPITGLPVE